MNNSNTSFGSLAKITLSILATLLLSACNTANSLMLSAKEREDKNYCLKIAHGSQTDGWAKMSLKEITSTSIRGEGNQKSKLYELDKILYQCGAILSPPNASPEAYQSEIATLRELSARIENNYIESERKLFLSRTGGRTICNGSTLQDFFYNQNIQPNGQCLYAFQSNNIPLQAAQATAEGVLVTSEMVPGRFIFLHNDNEIENALVDGAAIQLGYFAYVGNYSYISLIGPRRVYSFSRIANPFKDILFYRGDN